MAVKSRSSVRTRQPAGPVPINPYWLERGLCFFNLGNGYYWTKNRGWSATATTTGGPKNQTSKLGKVKGFGSTNGTGSTDRIDLPAIPMATGFRSIVAHLFANSTGGGTFGRVWQDVSGTGTSAGESFYINTSAGFTYYRQTSGTQGGHYSVTAPPMGVWFCAGLTADQTSTVVAQIPYLNGVQDTTTVTTVPDGTYTVGTTTPTFGNRASGDRNWNGMLGPIALFDHPTSGLTAAEHKELYDNIWQVLAPRRRKVPVAAGGAFTPSITEAITLADTASQVASLSASITEAATLSHSQDAIVGYAVSNTETLNLSHSQTNVANFPATITEAMTLTDSGTAQFGATSTISEAMTLADSSSNVAALSASITESMTLADSPNASASGDYTATQTEAMTLADTASNVAALSASITEAISLADSSSHVAALSRSISEALTLADTVSSSAAGDYTATITEAVTLADSSSNIATLSAAITESATLADTSTASSPGNFAASISESLALAEIASNQAALSAALVEALSLADNAASAWSRVVALTEAMTLNDATSQTLNAIITESAWWAYSVEPADLHYSVPAQDLTMSVEPQDLTFSIATLALAGR